ncbi:unnamed protein product [Effrenium voratum]|uniref:Uncharacterized protein n=2 Tax=Effrenium voratum TaxID=2562239 RepID=A0AA36MUT9_9DINO|nr:unnamed protein product [Effrenium voratum]
MEESQPTQPAEAAVGVPAQGNELLQVRGKGAPGCRHPLEGELVVGRKGHVQVEDKRCSARHLRIFQDEHGFFLEQLGMNVSFVNGLRLQQGDRRALRSGDEISLVNPSNPKSQKEIDQPPAVFIFRAGPSEALERRSLKRPLEETHLGGTLGVLAPDLTEEEIQESWDMRSVVLGKGSFSEVRLGVRVRDGRKHAVKVVSRRVFEKFQSSRKSRLSLVHEAELLKSLDHPHIVKCVEWFQTHSSLYLVMELVDGGDLLHNILSGGAFAEEDAQRLFRPICEAVAYLHEKEVVHRDLKPDNVLLTEKDRAKCLPKIADLGVAWKSAGSEDSRTLCGTPHYFAPEVINAKHGGYGKKVDVWSLGVVLYVLLSGTPPFEDEWLYEQIVQGKLGAFGQPEVRVRRRGVGASLSLREGSGAMPDDGGSQPAALHR